MVNMPIQEAIDNQGKINELLVNEIIFLKQKIEKLENNKSKFINVENKGMD